MNSIKCFGACCKRSLQTSENVKIAVQEPGLSIEVENTGDTIEIANCGVMSLPALMSNEKVVSLVRPPLREGCKENPRKVYVKA